MNATTRLLYPIELDAMLRFPRGRSKRLAKRGAIPCVWLPGGEIRFNPKTIDDWIERQSRCPQEAAR